MDGGAADATAAADRSDALELVRSQFSLLLRLPGLAAASADAGVQPPPMLSFRACVRRRRCGAAVVEAAVAAMVGTEEERENGDELEQQRNSTSFPLLLLCGARAPATWLQ